MIQAWLTAGVFERGTGFAPTEQGTPQGGVISPLLLNIALHGLEHAAGVRYITAGRQAGDTKAGSPVVIRYADDLVALCHTQEQAEGVNTAAATMFMVASKTAKKWADRYRTEGVAGMADRSSRPHTSPTKTCDAVMRRIVRLRWRHRIGPVQIGGLTGVPASTVHAVPRSVPTRRPIPPPVRYAEP